VRLAALHEAPYAFGSSYEREVEAPEVRWRQGLRDRTRYVAEVEGEVAGTVSGGAAGESSSASAAMTAMWVDPRFRRQGIGDLLVKTVIDWAKHAGYAHMFLWVADGNGAAERLYVRNGFKRTGTQQDIRPGQLEFELGRKL
jgi:GNAT superfamily N-acetyltransferase